MSKDISTATKKSSFYSKIIGCSLISHFFNYRSQARFLFLFIFEILLCFYFDIEKCTANSSADIVWTRGNVWVRGLLLGFEVDQDM